MKRLLEFVIGLNVSNGFVKFCYFLLAMGLLAVLYRLSPSFAGWLLLN